MIKQVVIEAVATYNNPDNPCEMFPNKINYMFGGNGTGKSAFSSVIFKPDSYNSCNIIWDDDILKSYVYDRPFVKRNFSEDKNIDGVFSIGEEDIETKEKIEKFISEKNELDRKISGYKNTRAEIFQEMKTKETEYKEYFWETKKNYNSIFPLVFKGHIKNKDVYMTKFLEQKDNDAELLTLEKLVESYSKLFNEEVFWLEKIDTIDEKHFDGLDNSVFTAPIVGVTNPTLKKIIDKLNNFDWIVNGIDYLKDSENMCPFCQQYIDDERKELLFEIVDETYKNEIRKIYDYKSSFLVLIEELVSKANAIILLEYSFFDIDELKNLNISIIALRDSNLQKILRKQSHPSESIFLSPLSEIVNKLNSIILKCNKDIVENNLIYKNLEKEKNKNKKEVWRFLYSIKDSLAKEYLSFYETKQKGFIALSKQMEELILKSASIGEEISEAKGKVTSIVHTASKINNTLKEFCFTNFELIVDEEEKSYRIERNNGEDAKSTLSEGEENFLTFLYFYHLLDGTKEINSIVENSVVVIDDPISSLDSNIMFVVCTLIKRLVHRCKDINSNIKQILILTHNVYFYKEVTFKGSGKHYSQNESFWLIRKENDISKIIKQDDNPIKSSYELLWYELRHITEANCQNTFNAMRRILEFYFQILGGIDYEKAVLGFSGDNLLLSSSLLSCINDGSHTVYEDLHMNMGIDSMLKFKNVFKSIFDNLGHLSHYKMMMKDEP